MRIFKKKLLPANDQEIDLGRGANTFVGRFTYGVENITVHRWDKQTVLSIGRYCSIAANINIFLGGNHRHDWITTFPFGHVYQKELGGQNIIGHPSTKGNVRIGNDVWIGSSVTIMSGVTIGDGAVIAANSHVACNVPPYAIYGGNPARKLKLRFDEAIIERLLRLSWWELAVPEVKKLIPTLSAPPSVEQLDALLVQTLDLPRESVGWK